MEAATDKTIDMEELAERMRTLDPDAWEQFADYFGPRLRRYFLRQELSVEDAEDAAADCIYRIPQAVSTHYRRREGGGFRSWVYAVAHNAFIDFVRQRSKGRENFRRAVEQALADDSRRAMEDPLLPAVSDVERLELDDLVQEAVSRLSPADQEIVRLRELESPLPYKDLSQAENVSVGALRVRRNRAMKRLRAQLEQDPRVKMLLARLNNGEGK